ncbi:hypothetical protein [Streptomyces subrutilus]|uniref:PLAT domain-containing protein n=1 Tax=Streptomyces subrutilus TaxID=36818 RepID=A0A1E5P0S3_9ACTN|nr:hypothetical protein [Streptomyces subrutilus]OEJ22488.1 hypothetical protein BGK67_33715 [Streptomyces subrutilus]
MKRRSRRAAAVLLLAAGAALGAVTAPVGAAPYAAAPSHQLRLVTGNPEDDGSTQLMVAPRRGGGWDFEGMLTKLSRTPGRLTLEAGEDPDSGRTVRRLATWCDPAGSSTRVSGVNHNEYLYLVWRGEDGLPTAWSSRHM